MRISTTYINQKLVIMATKYIKEDGSLDVEKICKLPYEEKKCEMAKLTREQMKEFVANLPINESHNPQKVIKVNYKKY